MGGYLDDKNVTISCFNSENSLYNVRHNCAKISLKNCQNLNDFDTFSQWSCLDPAVCKLTSNEKWLALYGLKTCLLKKDEIIRSIGFLVKEEYVPILGKFVKSNYSEGLFAQVDGGECGKLYNITANKGYLKQIENRLTNSIELFKRRLDWLCSGSRNLFGVLQEHSIVIILDIRTLSPDRLRRFKKAVSCFLSDQVQQIAQFNVFRCQTQPMLFSSEMVVVTSASIRQAVTWLEDVDLLSPTESSDTAASVSLLNKMSMKYDAVYLITEGESSLGSPELLKQAVTLMKCPLHIVAFDCTSVESLHYLHSLCDQTGGRFHAYIPDMQIPIYSAKHWAANDHQTEVAVHFLACTTCPRGWQQRTDCIRLFEELEEARDTLKLIQQVLRDIEQVPETVVKSIKQSCDRTRQPAPITNVCDVHGKREECMSSTEWLEHHGFQAQHLELFDVLAGVSFKHCDGVIHLLKPPEADDQSFERSAHEDNSKLSVPGAIVHPKLINARYCDQFVHVRWKDGSLVHVQVTPELYRSYARRVSARLTAIKKRIDWLSRGSRELFGTITEDDVYILIDTSTSMTPSIDYVKHKLLSLLSEQLQYKNRINLIAFNSKISQWNKHLVPTTTCNLESAAAWIRSLTCGGSTNTSAALQLALADRSATGIYLLSDGRPDQDPRAILLSMQINHPIPIHTVSFNCSDPEANQFLRQLSQETGGRFHYYTQTPKHPASDDQWESEEMRLLRAEYRFGRDNLEKMAQLRDECKRLAWRSSSHAELLASKERSQKRSASIKQCKRPTKPPSWISSSSYNEEHLSSESVETNLMSVFNESPRLSKSQEMHVASDQRKHNEAEYEERIHIRNPELIGFRYPLPSDQRTTRSRKQSSHRSDESYYSLLNSLCQKNNDSEDFVLIETKELLDRQARRYGNALQVELQEKQRKREEKKMAEVLNMEPVTIPNWIARYGLRAQELRLLDLIAPIAVPLRSTYVPVLKRHITSEVLRQTLPLAVVSTTKPCNKPKVRLINPHAIDFPKYEQSLCAALKRIEGKLVEIICQFLEKRYQQQLRHIIGLSDVVRWKTRLCWYQHKDAILDAFQKSGWPFPSDELRCLTNELDKPDITEPQSTITDNTEQTLFIVHNFFELFTLWSHFCYFFLEFVTFATLLCTLRLIHQQRKLSLQMVRFKREQLMAAQCNNNAQPGRDSVSVEDQLHFTPNTGLANSVTSSQTLPEHCVNRRIDLPCTCVHCRYIGSNRTRTLSPQSVKSPDPSVAELYGVRSMTISPDISQRDLPSESIDLGSLQAKTSPTPGEVWAWDTRFVSHQRSESPWLPSGMLSERYIKSHTCCRCTKYKSTGKSTRGSRSLNRLPCCKTLLKGRRHRCYVFHRSSMPNLKTSSWSFEPSEKILACNPDEPCSVHCSLSRELLTIRSNNDLAQHRLHSVDKSTGKSRLYPGTDRPGTPHRHGSTLQRLHGARLTPLSQNSLPLTEPEQITMSLETKRIQSSSPLPKSHKKFNCPSDLILPIISPPAGLSDDQMGQALKRQCHQRVIAFNDMDGIFYPGTVQKCISQDTSIIRFRHNGVLSEVLNQLTLPVIDMAHTQSLNDADTVLVRVKNVNESCECWVPARVQGGFLGSPDPRYPLRHLYQLRLFSGSTHVFRRRDILKINPKFYKSVVQYIKAKRAGSIIEEQSAAAGEGEPRVHIPPKKTKKSKPKPKPRKPIPIYPRYRRRSKKEPKVIITPKVMDKGGDSAVHKPQIRHLPERRERQKSVGAPEPKPVHSVPTPKSIDIRPKSPIQTHRMPQKQPEPFSPPVKKLEPKPVAVVVKEKPTPAPQPSKEKSTPAPQPPKEKQTPAPQPPKEKQTPAPQPSKENQTPTQPPPKEKHKEKPKKPPSKKVKTTGASHKTKQLKTAPNQEVTSVLNTTATDNLQLLLEESQLHTSGQVDGDVTDSLNARSNIVSGAEGQENILLELPDFEQVEPNHVTLQPEVNSVEESLKRPEQVTEPIVGAAEVESNVEQESSNVPELLQSDKVDGVQVEQDIELERVEKQIKTEQEENQPIQMTEAALSDATSFHIEPNIEDDQTVLADNRIMLENPIAPEQQLASSGYFDNTQLLTISSVPSGQQGETLASLVSPEAAQLDAESKICRISTNEPSQRQVSQDPGMVKQLQDGHSDYIKSLEDTQVTTDALTVSTAAESIEVSKHELHHPAVGTTDIEQTDQRGFMIGHVGKENKYQKQVHDETLVEPESHIITSAMSLQDSTSSMAQKITESGPMLNEPKFVDDLHPNVVEKEEVRLSGRAKQLLTEDLGQTIGPESKVTEDLNLPSDTLAEVKHEAIDHLKEPPAHIIPHDGTATTQPVSGIGLNKQIQDAISDQTELPEAPSARTLLLQTESEVTGNSEKPIDVNVADKSDVRLSEASRQEKVVDNRQLRKQLYDEQSRQTDMAASSWRCAPDSFASEHAIEDSEQPWLAPGPHEREFVLDEAEQRKIIEDEHLKKTIQDASVKDATPSLESAATGSVSIVRATSNEEIINLTPVVDLHVSDLPTSMRIDEDGNRVKQIYDEDIVGTVRSEVSSVRPMESEYSIGISATEQIKEPLIGTQSDSQQSVASKQVRSDQDESKRIHFESELLGQTNIMDVTSASPTVVKPSSTVVLEEIDDRSVRQPKIMFVQEGDEPIQKGISEDPTKVKQLHDETLDQAPPSHLQSIQSEETVDSSIASATDEKVSCLKQVTGSSIETLNGPISVLYDREREIQVKLLEQETINQNVLPTASSLRSAETTRSTSPSVNEESCSHLKVSTLGALQPTAEAKTQPFDITHGWQKQIHDESIGQAPDTGVYSLWSANSGASGTAPLSYVTGKHDKPSESFTNLGAPPEIRQISQDLTFVKQIHDETAERDVVPQFLSAGSVDTVLSTVVSTGESAASYLKYQPVEEAVKGLESRSKQPLFSDGQKAKQIYDGIEEIAITPEIFSGSSTKEPRSTEPNITVEGEHLRESAIDQQLLIERTAERILKDGQLIHPHLYDETVDTTPTHAFPSRSLEPTKSEFVTAISLTLSSVNFQEGKKLPGVQGYKCNATVVDNIYINPIINEGESDRVIRASPLSVGTSNIFHSKDPEVNADDFFWNTDIQQSVIFKTSSPVSMDLHTSLQMSSPYAELLRAQELPTGETKITKEQDDCWRPYSTLSAPLNRDIGSGTATRPNSSQTIRSQSPAMEAMAAVEFYWDEQSPLRPNPRVTSHDSSAMGHGQYTFEVDGILNIHPEGFSSHSIRSRDLKNKNTFSLMSGGLHNLDPVKNVQLEKRPHTVMSIHTEFTLVYDKTDQTEFQSDMVIRVLSLPGLLDLSKPVMPPNDSEQKDFDKHGKASFDCKPSMTITQNVTFSKNKSKPPDSDQIKSTPAYGKRIVAAEVAAVAALTDSGQSVGVASKSNMEFRSTAEVKELEVTGSSLALDSAHSAKNIVSIPSSRDPRLIGLSIVNGPDGEPIVTNLEDQLQASTVWALHDTSLTDVDRIPLQSAESLVESQEIVVANEYEIELDHTSRNSPVTQNASTKIKVSNELVQSKKGTIPNIADSGSEMEQIIHDQTKKDRKEQVKWQPSLLAPSAVSASDTNRAHAPTHLEPQSTTHISIEILDGIDSSINSRVMVDANSIPQQSNLPATRTVGRPQFQENQLDPALPNVPTTPLDSNRDREIEGKSATLNISTITRVDLSVSSVPAEPAENTAAPVQSTYFNPTATTKRETPVKTVVTIESMIDITCQDTRDRLKQTDPFTTGFSETMKENKHPLGRNEILRMAWDISGTDIPVSGLEDTINADYPDTLRGEVNLHFVRTREKHDEPHATTNKSTEDSEEIVTACHSKLTPFDNESKQTNRSNTERGESSMCSTHSATESISASEWESLHSGSHGGPLFSCGKLVDILTHSFDAPRTGKRMAAKNRHRSRAQSCVHMVKQKTLMLSSETIAPQGSSMPSTGLPCSWNVHEVNNNICENAISLSKLNLIIEDLNDQNRTEISMLMSRIYSCPDLLALCKVCKHQTTTLKSEQWSVCMLGESFMENSCLLAIPLISEDVAYMDCFTCISDWSCQWVLTAGGENTHDFENHTGFFENAVQVIKQRQQQQLSIPTIAWVMGSKFNLKPKRITYLGERYIVKSSIKTQTSYFSTHSYEEQHLEGWDHDDPLEKRLKYCQLSSTELINYCEFQFKIFYTIQEKEPDVWIVPNAVQICCYFCSTLPCLDSYFVNLPNSSEVLFSFILVFYVDPHTQLSLEYLIMDRCIFPEASSQPIAQYAVSESIIVEVFDYRVHKLAMWTLSEAIHCYDETFVFLNSWQTNLLAASVRLRLGTYLVDANICCKSFVTKCMDALATRIEPIDQCSNGLFIVSSLSPLCVKSFGLADKDPWYRLTVAQRQHQSVMDSTVGTVNMGTVIEHLIEQCSSVCLTEISSLSSVDQRRKIKMSPYRFTEFKTGSIEHQLGKETSNAHFEKQTHGSFESRPRSKSYFKPSTPVIDASVVLASIQSLDTAGDLIMNGCKAKKREKFPTACVSQSEVMSQTMLYVPSTRCVSMEGYASPILQYLAQMSDDNKEFLLTRMNEEYSEEISSISSFGSMFSQDLRAESVNSVLGSCDLQRSLQTTDKNFPHSPTANWNVTQNLVINPTAYLHTTPSPLLNSPTRFISGPCSLRDFDDKDIGQGRTTDELKVNVGFSDDMTHENYYTISPLPQRGLSSAHFSSQMKRYRNEFIKKAPIESETAQNCILLGELVNITGYRLPSNEKTVNLEDNCMSYSSFPLVYYAVPTRTHNTVQNRVKFFMVMKTFDWVHLVSCQHSSIRIVSQVNHHCLPIQLTSNRVKQTWFEIGHSAYPVFSTIQKRSFVSNGISHYQTMMNLVVSLPILLALPVVSIDVKGDFNVLMVTSHTSKITTVGVLTPKAFWNVNCISKPFDMPSVYIRNQFRVTIHEQARFRNVTKRYILDPKITVKDELHYLCLTKSHSWQTESRDYPTDKTDSHAIICPMWSITRDYQMQHSFTKCTITGLPLVVTLLKHSSNIHPTWLSVPSVLLRTCVQPLDNRTESSTYTTRTSEQYIPRALPHLLSYPSHLKGQTPRLIRQFRNALENLVNLPDVLLDSTLQTIRPLSKVHAFTELVTAWSVTQPNGAPRKEVTLALHNTWLTWIVDVNHTVISLAKQICLSQVHGLFPESQLLNVIELNSWRCFQMIHNADYSLRSLESDTVLNKCSRPCDMSCPVTNCTELEQNSTSRADSPSANSSSPVMFGCVVGVDNASPAHQILSYNEHGAKSATDRDNSERVPVDLPTESFQIRTADGDISTAIMSEHRSDGHYFNNRDRLRAERQTNIMLQQQHMEQGIPRRSRPIILSSNVAKCHKFSQHMKNEVPTRSNASSRGSDDHKSRVKCYVQDDRRRRWFTPPARPLVNVLLSGRVSTVINNLEQRDKYPLCINPTLPLHTAGDIVEGLERTEELNKRTGTSKELVSPKPRTYVAKICNRIMTNYKQMSVTDKAKPLEEKVKKNLRIMNSRIPLAQNRQITPGASKVQRIGHCSPVERVAGERNDRGSKSPKNLSKRSLKQSEPGLYTPTNGQRVLSFQSRIPIRATTPPKSIGSKPKLGGSTTKQVLYSTLRSRQALHPIIPLDRVGNTPECKRLRTLQTGCAAPVPSHGFCLRSSGPYSNPSKITLLKHENDKSPLRHKCVYTTVSGTNTWGLRNSSAHRPAYRSVITANTHDMNNRRGSNSAIGSSSSSHATHKKMYINMKKGQN